MPIVSTLLQVCLIIEIVLFAGVYLFGNRGMHALIALKKENDILEQEIVKTEREIALLRQEIDEWNLYPYYKEKIAREQLQMARKDEIIYLTITK